MTLPQIIEGNRDEIRAFLDQPEQEESHFRLVVVPNLEEQEEQSLDVSLAPLLEMARTLQPDKPVRHTDPQEAEISEKLSEKYRKMGFAI